MFEFKIFKKTRKLLRNDKFVTKQKFVYFVSFMFFFMKLRLNFQK